MADIKYMKAVEFDKLPAAFKKAYVSLDVLASKGYWLQRKYDGCFGAAQVDYERGRCAMVSRTGEDYSKSCEHILDELHELAMFNDQFNKMRDSRFMVLGEAWAEGVPFPQISGAFRRQTKGAQRMLSFVMNDLLPSEWQTSRSYEQRFSDLADFQYVEPCQAPSLQVAETRTDWAAYGTAMQYAMKWQAEGGYDGAILRNPSAGYTFGLVKQGEIIKVKPLLSLDIKVTDVFVEPGEKTGRDVFSIEVEYRGVRSKVGSGVPHKAAEVPGRGQIVQIDSLGLTESGALREPRFIAIRYDKTESDK